MKISVIGGSGFIGSRLVSLLSKNSDSEIRIHDVRISNEFPFFYIPTDVRSIPELRESIIDESIIINLAAQHLDNVLPRQLYYDVNVGGARNICNVASEKKVSTIIFTSSVAVYGFAPVGADESASINPFNDYGRTKYMAENIFKNWQSEDPERRTLVIIRPTVVFGERNRGNVFNLLRQIAVGKFIMVGSGKNKKSLAYVDNVAAFILHSMSLKPGIHVYNYADKPDLTMRQLVLFVKDVLGQSKSVGLRIPFIFGYLIAKIFDFVSAITGKQFAISSIRIKKFCTNSVYNTKINSTGFIPPVDLEIAIKKTIRYEFIETHDDNL